MCCNKLFMRLLGVGLLGACLLTPATSHSHQQVSTTAPLPLLFQGLPDGSGYLASGNGSQVVLRPERADILLQAPERATAVLGKLNTHGPAMIRTISMTLEGANGKTALHGSQPAGSKIHFLSSDGSQSRHVSPWLQVRADSIYKGIDLVYYGNDHRLEYDFRVAAGADPSQIRLHFEGMDSLKVSPDGNLVLSANGAELCQHRPIVYQVIDGRRVPVSGSYRICARDTVAFELGSYNPAAELVIDPVLSYSSYFGGTSGDVSMVVRLGPDDSIYIAGQTLSTRFAFSIPTGGFQRSFHGGQINGDAFVAKFDATGSNLLYFTYLGGSADDGAFDLAVDSAGNAYVTGFTTSPDFPVRNALMSRIHGGKDPLLHNYSKDAFVSELSPDGSQLLYSTYLGGTSGDVATCIAVDATGAACVAGTTVSSNFPTLNPIPTGRRFSGGQDAFITKLAPGGKPLVFSTYIGGRRSDSAQGIAVDSQGDIHVTGYTTSPNFPVTNAFQTQLNGTNVVTGVSDAWVAKLAGDGTLLYSTLLGAHGSDAGYRIAVDSANAAYVTGYTESRFFPNTLTNVPGITNARALSYANADAFLTKVIVNDAGAAEIAYSTVFGGSLSDVGWDVAVSPAGDAYVIGMTGSRNFPTNNTIGSLSSTNSGMTDIFLFALNAGATTVRYSGYIGGRGSDYGYGIALRSNGDVILTGRTVSTTFPTVDPLQSRRYGGNDAFLLILRPDE